MKILFLDIDGVMNSHQAIHMYYKESNAAKHGRSMPFCPISCSNLREILERIPDLKIVVSSTWRLGRTLEQLREDLAPMGIDSSRIIDKTPSNRMTRHRGQEIRSWIEDEAPAPVERFVIVDDDSDMGALMENLVQTDTRMGLMWDKMVEILKHFNAEGDLGIWL